jgi:hypothetical protein
VVLLLAAAMPATTTLAGPGEPGPEERGAAALKPFKRQLMSALVQGLKEGPESAIEVCRDLAPKIAEQAATETVTIGRTSHRLRNRANAPEPWMEPLLQKYVQNPKLSAPTVVSLPGGDTGYVEPITVGPACLKCHGTDIDPAVRRKIDALYPDDEARGFESGDFRGLFWARIRKAEHAPAKGTGHDHR